MPLSKVLSGITISDHIGNLDEPITGIAYDSRKVNPGDLFFATPGFEFDGHKFINAAIKRGAVAIVQEKMISRTSKTTCIQVPDVRSAMAISSANYYNHPSKRLILIGVTGTDGKTSTCRIIHHIMSSYGSVGLMGTAGHIILGRYLKASRTTPEAPEINRMLERLKKGGAYAAVMEVSSHALTLNRTYGLDFDLAVFTNLGADHLDFHRDMEDYFMAKVKLFNDLKTNGCAVINLDDPWGEKLANKSKHRVIGYSLKDRNVEAFGEIIYTGIEGIRMNVYYDNEIIDLYSPLIGVPNAYNILAAVSVTLQTKIGVDYIKKRISSFEGINGRFQKINCGYFLSVIDYAHTPQAIENMLKTLRPLTQKSIRIVFGCGGNRDKTKRPKMGAAAEEGADYIYLSTDNPRREDPVDIIQDIIAGMKYPEKARVILDRREAIFTSLEEAEDGDIVVITGKGHEDYQEINNVFHHFDDKEEVESWIAKKDKRS